MNKPSKIEITEAANRIGTLIHRTPVLTSHSINKIVGCELYFKCENFQKVGAFKFRGASNALSLLSKRQLANGVATHSSGNHAQALALAAHQKGAKAFIVMPKNAPKSKREAVLGYGAKVIECASTLMARETTLETVIQDTGAYFVHPYNNLSIIAGQATCALELIQDHGTLDCIIAPVGGGGLLSGTALSAHYFTSDIVVIGAEPSGADDAFRSFQANKIIPSTHPNTIADGLLTSLGDLTFPIIKKYVESIKTMEDSVIIEAMKLIWQRMKIIVEPSAAVPLAAVMKYRGQFRNQRVGIILSGGNIDFDRIPF
jgi:threonine dehydratase